MAIWCRSWGPAGRSLGARCAQIPSGEMNFPSGDPDARDLMREIRSRHPGLREALLADLKLTMVHRGEFREINSRADALLQLCRMMWVTDGFLAQALYRLKATLQRMGVPLVPRLAHHLALVTGQ